MVSKVGFVRDVVGIMSVRLSREFSPYAFLS